MNSFIGGNSMSEWWQWLSRPDEESLGFAVVGIGRFGTAVCRELIRNGADVLAVDSSERAIEELRQLEPSIEARVVDSTDEESIREAGVLEMGTVVVGISKPIEASITTTLIAKDSEGSRVRQVIARATSDLHERMLKRVGADRVVFPSRMQGERLGLELVRPNLIERLELDDQTGIDEIKVPEIFVGRSLRDLNLRKNYLVNVLAAGPSGQLTINPPAKYILSEDHVLVVMGLMEDLQKLPEV
ncbi:Trk system potassium uptake protein TrkA [Prochlorococcus sp. MIT 0603]|nr:Trk system potassium uptake protein TrkA [Prochlorococcus sp. MIT 0603]